MSVNGLDCDLLLKKCSLIESCNTEKGESIAGNGELF